jgi:hypothetical protein
LNELYRARLVREFGEESVNNMLAVPLEQYRANLVVEYSTVRHGTSGGQRDA